MNDDEQIADTKPEGEYDSGIRMEGWKFPITLSNE